MALIARGAKGKTVEPTVVYNYCCPDKSYLKCYAVKTKKNTIAMFCYVGFFVVVALLHFFRGKFILCQIWVV